MKVWTIANQKGGVGKTTTVASLAGTLAKRGQRVLMIDTDPHASLGYYLGIDSEEVPGSLYDLFLAHKQLDTSLVKQHAVPTSVEGVDLLAATMALATLDRALGHQEGMGLVLRNILNSVEEDYDVALVDCPPVLGVLMVNALAASQHIVIPVQTEFLAIKGLDRMIKTMELMGRSKKTRYSYSIVPTMYDRRTKASPAALQHLGEVYGDTLWPDVIPVDTKFRDASLAHLPASHYAPNTRGVKAYERLLDYLLAGEFNHVKIG
ncbi:MULTISPECIES: ParA family protein [Shewanella]|uniref:ParA family protein n=1 Tax=Shewanella indica TaxID=768528 RepID=A0ABU4QD05_9GAMM|nr:MULTISPECIES: ParA family protein [Shewanella]MCL1160679.1 ParA family protein [Shewanella chilikensis]OIN03925.1 cobalamin biosynthesis protein CobQ [Shewanella algae]MCE9790016.1 ParA family protein [Shewanella indica]MDX6017274.1 ParA family protein [Shewanella indica]TVP09775.1 cobalamin biosynthesis protein CobQ [Shewanella sp. MSW]